ncbi:MAG: hypothetical protein ACJZ1R_05870 [Candidatus Neomarinimicrobiota bacterium]
MKWILLSKSVLGNAMLSFNIDIKSGTPNNDRRLSSCINESFLELYLNIFLSVLIIFPQIRLINNSSGRFLVMSFF